MEGVILILFFIVVIPLVFVIMGIVKLCSSNEQKRKAGLRFLLGGIGLFGAFVLFGYSICSSIKIGGGH
jgi:hypothetical protein